MGENRNNDQPSVESEVWCMNDIRTSKTTFTWKIKGFKDHHSTYNLEGIKSGEIFIRGREDGDRDSRWMLEIKPRSIRTLPGWTIEIVLHSKNNETLKARICLQIIDPYKKERTEAGKVMAAFNFKKDSSCVLQSDLPWSAIIGSPEKFLLNDDLEFIFDITLAYSSFSLGSANNKKKGSNHEHKSPTNYEEFFLSKEMSDIQIKCGDKTFDAHQVVLSAWSPVFRGMFQAEMKEKESKVVEIQDLDPITVMEMFKFIYTGRCCVSEEDPDPKIVSDLLEAADKYQVVVLKEMCEKVMIKILEPNNSLQILEYADIYGAQELKKRALDLVVANMKSIRGSDDWKESARKRPHLCVEISEALADRM